MQVLITLHSLVRWLILVAGVATIVRAAWGWLGGLDFVRSDNILGVVFNSLMDVNLLVGIILLVLRWGDLNSRARLHPGIMILAVVVAHGARMLGRERGAKARHLFQGGGILASLVLVLIGIRFVT